MPWYHSTVSSNSHHVNGKRPRVQVRQERSCFPTLSQRYAGKGHLCSGLFCWNQFSARFILVHVLMSWQGTGIMSTAKAMSQIQRQTLHNLAFNSVLRLFMSRQPGFGVLSPQAFGLASLAPESPDYFYFGRPKPSKNSKARRVMRTIP